MLKRMLCQVMCKDSECHEGAWLGSSQSACWLCDAEDAVEAPGVWEGPCVGQSRCEMHLSNQGGDSIEPSLSFALVVWNMGVL